MVGAGFLPLAGEDPGRWKRRASRHPHPGLPSPRGRGTLADRAALNTDPVSIHWTALCRILCQRSLLHPQLQRRSSQSPQRTMTTSPHECTNLVWADLVLVLALLAMWSPVIGAEPQGFVVIPRGAVHTHQNTGAKPGVLQGGVTPAGFESYVIHWKGTKRAGEQGPDEETWDGYCGAAA
jgi:hypothetical protein